jgi:hypothetical protein
VTLAEYFEEKLRAGLRERHIAEFVDDEQFDGGELRLLASRVGSGQLLVSARLLSARYGDLNEAVMTNPAVQSKDCELDATAVDE